MDLTREPLLSRATIVSAVGLLVALAGALGMSITSAVSDQLVEVLLALAVVAGPLVHAWWSRKHVTPVADPRDDAGRPLVALPRGGVINIVNAPADPPPPFGA